MITYKATAVKSTCILSNGSGVVTPCVHCSRRHFVVRIVIAVDRNPSCRDVCARPKGGTNGVLHTPHQQPHERDFVAQEDASGKRERVGQEPGQQHRRPERMREVEIGILHRSHPTLFRIVRKKKRTAFRRSGAMISGWHSPKRIACLYTPALARSASHILSMSSPSTIALDDFDINSVTFSQPVDSKSGGGKGENI